MTLKATTPQYDHAEEFYFGVNMVMPNNSVGDIAAEGALTFLFKRGDVVGAKLNGCDLDPRMASVLYDALFKGPRD